MFFTGNIRRKKSKIHIQKADNQGFLQRKIQKGKPHFLYSTHINLYIFQ